MVIARTWFYYNVKDILLQEKRSKVESLATTIAQSISGEQLSILQTQEGQNTPAFKHLASSLIQIRSASRKSNLDIGAIYFIRQVANNPSEVEITIDVGNHPHANTYFLHNAIWPEARTNGILAHIKENWATESLYPNRGGNWLTGIAPIYDSQDRYIATIAVDVGAKSINQAMSHLLSLAFLTGTAMFLVGSLLATFLVRAATRSLDIITKAVEEIGRGNLKTRIELQTKDEFGALALAINNMEKGLEENERLKLNFVRYVSKHVMEKILSSDISGALKGERRKITVLFSDIRHFASLSEKLPPEEVVCLLNEYLDRMLSIIFYNNGTLDKFMGDGIMAEFGAPLEDPEQEYHAIQTAIQMQSALKELNQKWKKEKALELEMSIGINTGFAIVGNIGSDKRMEYTAIGDTVNVASRLQHASKEHDTTILISQTTAAALKNQYRMKSLGSLKLVGRESPIEAFTIELGEK